MLDKGVQSEANDTINMMAIAYEVWSSIRTVGEQWVLLVIERQKPGAQGGDQNS